MALVALQPSAISVELCEPECIAGTQWFRRFPPKQFEVQKFMGLQSSSFRLCR
jgi:hypothetical protein